MDWDSQLNKKGHNYIVNSLSVTIPPQTVWRDAQICTIPSKVQLRQDITLY